MRILVISDTHRKNDNYLKVVEETGHLDMVIHCGDVEGSEYSICAGAGCPVEMVSGNNDFFSELPREKEIRLGKHRIFITHGHNYYVSMNNEVLKQEARDREADVVIYGHTHRPLIERNADILVMNPGSISYPRQEGKRPSYIIMEIPDKGEIQAEIHYL